MSNRRIGDEAVKGATGRDWAEWLKILDRDGARTMTHQEIVALLVSRHDVGPWWQQMVAVTYEQERGLREPHQTSGGFSTSVSRTVSAPLEKVFAAWSDGRRRTKWLGAVNLTVRKSTSGKSMRITWSDDSSVEVYFLAKGASKSQVTVQHSKLAGKHDVADKKELWSAALARLKEQIEG